MTSVYTLYYNKIILRRNKKMEKIKIIDYNGTEKQGSWNGKVYPSKIENSYRIYIDNTEVLISLEEANRITNNTVNAQMVYYYFNKLLAR